MATTNYDLVAVWQVSKPRTFRALQDAFVAAKKAISSKGKRGLFGGDKEATSQAVVVQCINKAIAGMIDDGIIVGTSDPTLKLRLELEIGQFVITFPNWPDEREYLNGILDLIDF